MNDSNPKTIPAAADVATPRKGAWTFDERTLGCSTLSFRLDPLGDALDAIVRIGFAEFDLGVYPGYCEHYDALCATDDGRATFADRVKATGLTTRTLNVHPGSFSGPRADSGQLWAALREEVILATALGAVGVSMATGEIGPELDREQSLRQEIAGFRRLAALAANAGLMCLVEAPHFGRVCDTVDAAARLIEEIDQPTAYLTLDTSHIVASGADVAAAARSLGPRARHVHLRDGRRGEMRLPVGRGAVDFGGFFRELARVNYEGHFTLELATEGSPLPKEQEVNEARRLILALWAGGDGLDGSRPEHRLE